MSVRLALIVLGLMLVALPVAGCTKSQSSTQTPLLTRGPAPGRISDELAAANANNGRAAKSNDVACPPKRSIARALRLHGSKTRKTIEEVRCLRGRFPHPVVVVAAILSDGSETDAGEMTITGIDDKDRLVFRHSLAAYSDPTGVYETYKLDRLVDLNGDGKDEIFLRREVSNPMSSGDSLVVLDLRGTKLHTLLERDLGGAELATFGGRGEHDYRPVPPARRLVCKASVAVERGKDNKPLLVITRVVTAGKNVGRQRIDEFCGPSKETFAYRAGKLQKLRHRS